MKRMIFLLAAALSLTTADCQTVNEVTDSVKSARKSGNVKTIVSTVKGAFSTKDVDTEKIIGTWVYVKPVVISTTKNVLSKMATNSVAPKLEAQLNKYCEKAKVSAANTYFKIRANGTYTYTFVGDETTGTWMADGDKLRFAVKNVQSTEVTSRMEHTDTLSLVMDTSILLKEIQGHGGISDSKTNKELVKLAKHVKNLKSGFILTRKK